MAKTSENLLAREMKRYQRHAPDCRWVRLRIRSLSDYFALFNSMIAGNDTFWFRGHSDLSWKLIPSALRYKKKRIRDRALGLITDFKRLIEIRLTQVPRPNEELKWMQLAQHYGLPTRLLDWTQNAAIALYFACLDPHLNGVVFALNPIDLNRIANEKFARVLDANLDFKIIDPYLKLDGGMRSKGRKTIAIHPIWNSERIMLQQGTFTLHGSRKFTLNKEQAPSLVGVPILSDYKEDLLDELQRVGVSEMSVFPEAEHVCGHLRRIARLEQ